MRRPAPHWENTMQQASSPPLRQASPGPRAGHRRPNHVRIQRTIADTYQGLILAYETGLLPFTIWLMRVYFTEVPRELDEAAWIDGCSKMHALWKVVLPTVWPGLTTVGLLVGLAS